MVKKTSLLSKLKSKLQSGSVRVQPSSPKSFGDTTNRLRAADKNGHLTKSNDMGEVRALGGGKPKAATPKVPWSEPEEIVPSRKARGKTVSGRAAMARTSEKAKPDERAPEEIVEMPEIEMPEVEVPEVKAPRARVAPAKAPKTSEPKAEIRSLAAGPRGERVSSRKLAAKEEAVLALGEGFQELSSLMRGVQTRLDGQGTQMGEVADGLRQLPAVQQAQLEALQGLASHLERQNTLGVQVADSLKGLPQMMTGVQAALERAASADERTAKTMGEFQNTMNRIHQSMGLMVQDSKSQADAVQKIAGKTEEARAEEQEHMRGMVADLRQSTSESVTALRSAQEDQSTRLQKAVEENGKWSQAVLVLLAITVVGLLAVLGVVLFK